MAGTIVHLAVADGLCRELNGKIRDKSLFFLGNIAPDAIHQRDGYQRSMKMHSHLRDGIRDSEFHYEENQKLFHSRLDEFAEKYCVRTDENYDLYCGYLSHLITDECFIKTLRFDFWQKMKSIGIEHSDRRFLENISHDIFNNDYRLISQYHFEDDVKQRLFSADGWEVRDHISAGELELSRKWTLKTFFESQKEYEHTEYIGYESTLRFIENSVIEIKERFEKYGLYGR